MSLAVRRRSWLGAAGVLGGALLVAAVFVPLPFVELSPGPTFNVIGEVDGRPLIDISGTTTYPTAGNLDMTTVNERGGPETGIYLGRVIAGWADPHTRVLPREAFYPDQETQDDVAAQNSRQFSDSTSDSVAAALSYLKLPIVTYVVVSSVLDGAPADGHLEPGDQILAIDGTAITAASDVGTAMRKVKPGAVVVVKVKRSDSDTHDETITTGANPIDASRAFLGIEASETYHAKFHLEITLGGVGGPSAGMMLSMGIVDKLTPGELNGGGFVAGTGTITPDGEVGPIGGIEQKLVGARNAGATLFLAPATNCRELLDNGIPSGLTVASVSTLADAVTAVENYTAGKPVTPCSR